MGRRRPALSRLIIRGKGHFCARPRVADGLAMDIEDRRDRDEADSFLCGEFRGGHVSVGGNGNGPPKLAGRSSSNGDHK